MQHISKGSLQCYNRNTATTMPSLLPEPKRRKVQLTGQAAYKKKTQSTLPLHVDGSQEADARIQSVICDDALWTSELQAAVHLVDGGMVIGPRSGKYGRYTSFSDAEVDGMVDLKCVTVPKGAVILWCGDTPHGNYSPSINPPFPVAVVPSIAMPTTQAQAFALAKLLHTHGYAVVHNVIPPAECDAWVEGLLADNRWAANGNPLGPPGGKGCHIGGKYYALCYTHTAQTIRLDPRIKAIFALLYGENSLVLSCDAYSLVVDHTEAVQRCCSFIAWAPKAAMYPGSPQKKLKQALRGGSMCHDPLKMRPGGGPGHMSNKREGGWRSYTVLAKANPGCVQPRYQSLLPATLKAFGL